MNHIATVTESQILDIQSIIPSSFFGGGGDELNDLVVMELAVIMFVAAIMLGMTRKIKQPMVIGYIILAGMLIGPYTQPFSLVSSIETVNLMAELGIILLLFVVEIEYTTSQSSGLSGKMLSS
jgi:CPA2 family monovalent cation:H+ antiporter-2